jgi:hypothetical protein
MIHRARCAELSTALSRKCLPRRCVTYVGAIPLKATTFRSAIPRTAPARVVTTGPRRAADAARARRRCHRIERNFTALPYVGFWQILLQKSLMVLANSDSVALIRFAAESGDDGAAQSRPRSAVLLVLS